MSRLPWPVSYKMGFCLLCVGMVVCSALVGFVAAQQAVRMERAIWISQATIPPSPSTTIPMVSSTSALSVLPLDVHVPMSSMGTALFDRQRSAVLNLVHKNNIEKIGSDTLVANHQLNGAAVALSSDGWLVTMDSAFKDIHPSDVSVIYAGHVYPVQTAIHDLATDAVFIKIAAQDLPVAAFVDAEDVNQGLSVWTEPATGDLSPQTIVDVHHISSPLDPVSSERAARRFVVTNNQTTTTAVALAGGAVWAGDGRLVGLMDQRTTDGWTVLPASDLNTALSAVLSGEDIRHASLGVHTIDLSDVAFMVSSTTLPMRGAWIHVDRHGSIPGIVKGGPAVAVLQDQDVIERIERDIIDGTADLGERLLAYPAGTRVTIAGTRQGTPFQTSIMLGSVVTSERLK